MDKVKSLALKTNIIVAIFICILCPIIWFTNVACDEEEDEDGCESAQSGGTDQSGDTANAVETAQEELNENAPQEENTNTPEQQKPIETPTGSTAEDTTDKGQDAGAGGESSGGGGGCDY